MFISDQTAHPSEFSVRYTSACISEGMRASARIGKVLGDADVMLCIIYHF